MLILLRSLAAFLHTRIPVVQSADRNIINTRLHFRPEGRLGAQNPSSPPRLPYSRRHPSCCCWPSKTTTGTSRQRQAGSRAQGC